LKSKDRRLLGAEAKEEGKKDLKSWFSGLTAKKEKSFTLPEKKSYKKLSKKSKKAFKKLSKGKLADLKSKDRRLLGAEAKEEGKKDLKSWFSGLTAKKEKSFTLPEKKSYKKLSKKSRKAFKKLSKGKKTLP
jgi:uncharacterized membrane protein YfbV (UPF0208 family)